MKKLVVALAILFGLASTAHAVTATWEHDGQNTTGYVLYWHPTQQGPTNEYSKVVNGNTVRSMVLDDGYFAPGVSYTFSMVAFRDVDGEENDAMSVRSASVQWTRPGEPFVAPADKLPSTLYLTPNNINQIVITLP